MTNYNTVHTTITAVRETGDRYTESGMRIPAPEVRAREIADQAGRWLALAAERTRMRPATLTTKALQATAFSVLHGASSFAVPSKLTGISRHQAALWAVVRDPSEPWAALELDPSDNGLTVSLGGETLGQVQTKHLPWLRPLLPFGLTVHLGRVTGHAYDGYSLGCNVVFGHVGQALDRLLDALGRTVHGTSGNVGGDGVPGGPVALASGPARGLVRRRHGTRGPSGGLSGHGGCDR